MIRCYSVQRRKHQVVYHGFRHPLARLKTFSVSVRRKTARRVSIRTSTIGGPRFPSFHPPTTRRKSESQRTSRDITRRWIRRTGRPSRDVQLFPAISKSRGQNRIVYGNVWDQRTCRALSSPGNRVSCIRVHNIFIYDCCPRANYTSRGFATRKWLLIDFDC